LTVLHLQLLLLVAVWPSGNCIGCVNKQGSHASWKILESPGFFP